MYFVPIPFYYILFILIFSLLLSDPCCKHTTRHITSDTPKFWVFKAPSKACERHNNNTIGNSPSISWQAVHEAQDEALVLRIMGLKCYVLHGKNFKVWSTNHRKQTGLPLLEQRGFLGGGFLWDLPIPFFWGGVLWWL